MSFYRRIKYFLVHTLKHTNEVAQDMLAKGLVEMDNVVVKENVFLSDDAEIKVEGKVVRPKKDFIYIKFNKPAGYESTLSKNVENNLSEFFTDQKGLSIAGRLDKASEGLLLLSNNGKWVENITNPLFEKEKEYIVELDKEPGEDFVTLFTKGVNIGYHVTKPCECSLLGGNKIKVKLKEGKNRQIRKMCKTLGYNVLSLKRTKIDNVELKNLEEGKWEFFKV
ncbi:MAG: rRNA pseudouridine synthase [Bacteroidetes bacterium]|nr:rRNA pseudouridine synthase [Bacteroidota bacterium]